MNRVRNSTLDIIRGLAALEVMFGHLRGFVFEDFPRLPHPSFLVKVFYYLTGFGHQAVIIFFVLSGYLVGGSVLAAKQDGFWIRYPVQRLSRLWIVLLPCLVATLVWNTLGLYTGGAEYLHGAMNPPITSAPLSDSVHTDLLTFLGNLLFLQTIATPVFGDNGPLWSLANEFWYYAMFPLLFFGTSKTFHFSIATRFSLLAALAAIVGFLPWMIISGFFIWLFGVVIYAAMKHRAHRVIQTIWVGGPCLVACAALFHLSRGSKIPDIWLGLAFSAALPLILRSPTPPRLFAASSAWLSDFSYTLYLVHFSFAAFLWYTLFAAQRLEPSPSAAGRFILLSIIVVAYSFGLSLIFERNTDRLRRYAMAVISGK